MTLCCPSVQHRPPTSASIDPLLAPAASRGELLPRRKPAGRLERAVRLERCSNPVWAFLLRLVSANPHCSVGQVCHERRRSSGGVHSVLTRDRVPVGRLRSLVRQRFSGLEEFIESPCRHRLKRRLDFERVDVGLACRRAALRQRKVYPSGRQAKPRLVPLRVKPIPAPGCNVEVTDPVDSFGRRRERRSRRASRSAPCPARTARHA